MGACNIEIYLTGKQSGKEIDEAFNRQQEDDAAYNGHRDGYSGDFQTVREVQYHLTKVFESHDLAHDYCLNNAEKWHSVVAVYYKEDDTVNTLVAGWGAC